MIHHIDVVREAFEKLCLTRKHPELCDKLHMVLVQMQDQNKALLPDWGKLKKPIMAIDFDGVISEYKRGWQGEAHNLEGERPVDGAIDFISRAVQNFTVLIFSSRCNTKLGQLAIEKFLIEYGLTLKDLEQITFQAGKPSYHIIIDDRAFAFKGKWPSSPQWFIDEFRPWYYGLEGWDR